MPKIHNTIHIDGSPASVWQVLGDLQAVTRWVPGVVSAQVDGDKRLCKLADGQEIREEIFDYAPDRRSYAYRHTQTPMPVRNSTGRLAVEADGDGAVVVWEAEFEALDTAMEAPLTAQLDAAFKQTLESLRASVV